MRMMVTLWKRGNYSTEQTPLLSRPYVRRDLIGEFVENTAQCMAKVSSILTNSSVVEAICKKGFDWRVCGKHGTMYGQGKFHFNKLLCCRGHM